MKRALHGVCACLLAVVLTTACGPSSNGNGAGDGGAGNAASADGGGAGGACTGSSAARIGQACSAGFGGCRREGVYVCDEDTRDVVCDAVAGEPVAEICDGDTDADCDFLRGCEDPDCGGCGECGYCENGLCAYLADGASCVSDDKPCTRDVCEARVCLHVPGDGDACSGGSCSADVCEGPVRSVDGTADARLGASVSLGPDVDGDDLGDILVGAPGATVGAMQSAGRVCLYSGATGLELRCWDGESADERFGSAVSLGPDVDGDGFGDVLATAFPGGPPPYARGKVSLYSGATGELLRSWERNSSGNFGESISLGPDADGDGSGDVLIGASFDDLEAPSDSGQVFLYSGATGAQLHTWIAAQAGEHLGRSVSLGPDADGDGLGDVLIGAWQAGSPRVGRVDLRSGVTGKVIGTWHGDEQGDYFGFSVSLGPDVDGDALGDVLIGAFGGGDYGRATLYSSATGALLQQWEGESSSGSAVFARGVVLGPDADGDGRGDVLITASEANRFTGRAYLYSGANGARLRAWVGEGEFQSFGGGAALGPDVDGDGLADVILGAPGAATDAAQEAGRLYVFTSDSWTPAP